MLLPSNEIFFENDNDNNSIPFVLSKNNKVVNINGINPLKDENQNFKEETRSYNTENSNSIVNEEDYSKKRNFSQMNTTNIGSYNSRAQEEASKKRKLVPVQSQEIRRSPTPTTIFMNFFCFYQ